MKRDSLAAWAGAVIVAGTIVAGAVLEARGVVLGTPTPPFLGPYLPRAHPLLLVGILTAAAAAWGLPRTLGLRPAAFAAVTLVAALAVRLAVNVSRHGVDELDRAFDLEDSFEGKNEYLPALRALQYGPRFTLDRWAELIPALPPHPGAHPPGTLLVLDGLGITTSQGMAALCIAAAVVAVPLTYLTARAVTDDRRARVATLLLVLCPQAVLFGATSADALFLAMGLLAAWPLAVYAAGGGTSALAAGATAAAIGSFFAWSLPAVAAWAALVALLRGGVRPALVLAAACAAAGAVLYGVLALASGYDVVGALRETNDLYRFSVASQRPYAYWLLGSPAAFLVVLGLPTAWLFLRAVGRRDDLAVAIGAVLATAAVLGFTKAETERIWLFFAPFACLAAAGLVGPRALRPVLVALAVQAVAVEVLFDTVW